LVEFRLRPATQADSESIRQIIRQTRLNPIGLDWRRFLIVETPNGNFAGCGQIKPHRGEILELASLAVAEPYRGQGVARLVIQRLLADEKSRPIYLTCRSELGGFYEKFGFQALSLAEMPPYYRRLSRLANLLLAFSKSRMLVMALETPIVEKYA
jgi:N-acetylglutamate synthase-like GNAT family acetyltransferase